jgi:hypothetical protein
MVMQKKARSVSLRRRNFLREGERSVRCATENIFVYAISQFIDQVDTAKSIKKQFKKVFGDQYKRFINCNYP